jgi:hypothetical protein
VILKPPGATLGKDLGFLRMGWDEREGRLPSLIDGDATSAFCSDGCKKG